MKVSTSGSYAGIGVEVVAAKGGVSVVGRMAGSPAERAGILNGDVIVSIDGIAVDPADLDTAIARMRGRKAACCGWRCSAKAAPRCSSSRSSASTCSCTAWQPSC